MHKHRYTKPNTPKHSQLHTYTQTHISTHIHKYASAYFKAYSYISTHTYKCTNIHINTNSSKTHASHRGFTHAGNFFVEIYFVN